MKKRPERRKHWALAVVRRSQKNSPRGRPPSRGRQKFNRLEMATTFTYRPSLVKIDAKLSAQCNKLLLFPLLRYYYYYYSPLAWGLDGRLMRWDVISSCRIGHYLCDMRTNALSAKTDCDILWPCNLVWHSTFGLRCIATAVEARAGKKLDF